MGTTKLIDLTREIRTAERITTLEGEVKKLSVEVEQMNSKLDELLDLRSKGMGAFWLASTILGAGIIGMVVQFIAWLKG